jgi:murein L,D-transpeptidase YcbB/YkuD
MVNADKPNMAKLIAQSIRAAACALLPFLASPVMAKGADLAPPAPVAIGQSEGDMHYVDAELRPYPGGDVEDQNFLVDSLLDARDHYRVRWGALPQNRLTYKRKLSVAAEGPEVAALRTRLGLATGDRFDAELAEVVEEYRRVHGLALTAEADRALYTSLNRGEAHYLALLDRNIERARAIPQDLPKRFVFVDVTAQRLHMFEGQESIDAMKVVIGKRSMPTPSLAAYIRHAEVRPYWNLPADLVKSGVARRAVAQGPAYLQRAGYQVMSDYGAKARPLPAHAIDWPAVVRGEEDVRVVQKPGPYNAMGDVKFMFPNRLGIYLHDTPQTDLFASSTRMFSAGCVRLEDATRLARWLYGENIVAAGRGPSHRIELDEEVPVFIIYLTAWPDADGRLFRDDIYDRDTPSRAHRIASR